MLKIWMQGVKSHPPKQGIPPLLPMKEDVAEADAFEGPDIAEFEDVVEVEQLLSPEIVPACRHV